MHTLATTELHPGHISWAWRLALFAFGLWFGGTGAATLTNWKGAARLHAILANPWWRLLSERSRRRQIALGRRTAPIGIIIGLFLIGLGIHG